MASMDRAEERSWHPLTLGSASRAPRSLLPAASIPPRTRVKKSTVVAALLRALRVSDCPLKAAPAGARGSPPDMLLPDRILAQCVERAAILSSVVVRPAHRHGRPVASAPPVGPRDGPLCRLERLPPPPMRPPNGRSARPVSGRGATQPAIDGDDPAACTGCPRSTPSAGATKNGHGVCACRRPVGSCRHWSNRLSCVILNIHLYK